MQATTQPRRVSRRQALAAMSVPIVLHRWGFASSALQVRVEGTLLVRGDADLPGGEVAWRVVQDVAEARNEAIFQRRALGFSVNTSIFTDLLFTDEVTQSAYRLAPDEAAFVAEGTMQRRESMSGAPEQYLRLALVQADLATQAGGDRLVFAGPAFVAPVGTVTLTLERLALQAGDRAHAGTGVGQTLILVLQGEIEIEEGESGPITQLQTVVGSGISYAAHSTPWGTSVTALRDGTIVLLAAMQ